MTRVAVIGGGIAGLIAARRLAAGGATVTLFETGDRLGGMLAPGELEGVRFDIGAEAFAVRGGAVAALVEELGFGDDIVVPRALGSWTLGADGASASPAGGLLGIPSGADAAGLAEAIGPAGLDAVRAEAALDPTVGADAVTLADLIRTRYGEAVLERLVAPVVRGVYSLDPDLVDHRVLVPGLAERMQQHGSLGAAVASMRAAAPAGALVNTVRGGMHQLITALERECRQLGVAIRLGSPAVVRDGALVAEATDFDRILVTTAAGFDGAVTAPTISTEVVALLLHAPALDAHPRGTGVLVADAEGVEAKALTHASAKWEWLDDALRERHGPGHHLIRLSYAPRHDGEPARTLRLADAELQQRALADAGRILGVELAPDQLRGLARQEWRIPQPPARLGRRDELAALRAEVAALPNIDACGTWIDGTGLALVVPGALAAADRILAAD